MRRLDVAAESWPIAGRFTISRGSKTAADVVVVTLAQDGAVGRGECVPYPRYGETAAGAVAALEAAREAIEGGLGREDIARHVAPMAARNTLDCALWDLQAKLTGTPVWRLAGLAQPRPLVTAYTISLGEPPEMAEAAARAAARPLLKLKLGKPGDPERLAAVRAAVPRARLIVDANEGWPVESLTENFEACARAGVELVEQPLPQADDEALRGFALAVPVCADESAHGVESLQRLRGLYDMLNVKLDKTGGLTGALAMARAAQDAGLGLMTGCMVATSLAMAPAMLVAGLGGIADLDGPLLLARDREPAIRYDGGLMHPAPPGLWG